MEFHQGLGYARSCRLSNTTHSEIAPSLTLPSLPVCFGATDQEIRLSDEPDGNGIRPVDRPDVLDHASTIAGFLRSCDVSYINLKEDARTSRENAEHSRLYHEVLKFNPGAFDCSIRGPLLERVFHTPIPDQKPIQKSSHIVDKERKEYRDSIDEHNGFAHEPTVSAQLKKPKFKRRKIDPIPLATGPDLPDQQDLIGSFNEFVEDFCGKAENSDDLDDIDTLSVSLSDVKSLVNEIMSSRTKKILQLVPFDSLLRLINVLDRQIHLGQGMLIDGNESIDPDSGSQIFVALESVHAALAVMSFNDMPKQLYKEEVIERVIDFTRHQITECMAICNPHTFSKPIEDELFEGELDEYDDINNNSAGRKRRGGRSANLKKSTGNKVSATVSSVIQKLCSILELLKDLLSVERLTDSCILQLVKSSFSTFLVENIQLLQLKSINLICGIFASYEQHRNFLIDEILQLLWKLQFSKRALRTYHLPDEEQKQIQMVTALLIQMVHSSANLPKMLRLTGTWSTLLDASVDASFPTNCLEAATESCCLFWTNVLQRLSAPKSQDTSEFKVILENLVADLLMTLNLPEYPASAPVLEVLCVLLLQNAGLKSKDTSARCLAIELLGTVAARLKRDATICNKDKLWILQELHNEKSSTKEACSVCLSGRGVNVVCHVCQRRFHADCIGTGGQETFIRDWSCHVCLCKKQLVLLKSYCKSQCQDHGKKNKNGTGIHTEGSESVSGSEVVQQILLNHLQETGFQDEANLFTRWFHLCLWYKDDPLSQENVMFYLARLKSKAILRDSGTAQVLSRDWTKRICLALCQKNSFSRGFDKILSLLLASLRESSPTIRARALHAVSIIVEADPGILGDKRVQSAVEGRFCDSSISVREAALALVSKHIASHPDVGLQYFEKVAERTKDTGVSVRKRAIKIIRDLCVSKDNFDDVINAFIEIISRVSDEESSIQDLVCKTFYELWFEEPSGGQTRFVGNNSSVPVEVAKKTEQIVDVLRKIPNHNLLITVIKRNLALDFLPQSAKTTGISAVSIATIRRRCELVCKHLLERILQVEEGNHDDGDDVTRALPYVLALHSFCVVDPMLCVPATDPTQFVVTLLPYLKNQVDNKAIAKLLESIIFVMNSVLPLLRKPPQSVIEELEQDLKNMIVRHSYLTVVHSCVKCLCSLSKIAGKGANLIEYLIQTFLKHLHGPTSDNKQPLGRSLFCLGLLVRYGNELIIASNNQSMHIDKSITLVKRYLQVDDLSLKVRALQALGYVLISKPEYMLEKDIGQILEETLHINSDSRLKMQALQNLYEYLLDAESQLTAEVPPKTVSVYPEDVGNKVPVAAGAGDTNICGGIIQLYWANVLELCLDVSDQVRQSALKIVEIVLRQGLVHPITSVPCLLALETDPLEVNSKLAHHLLMNMNEKYPAFFESRLGDGLHLSFKFVQSIASNYNVASGKSKTNFAAACVKPGISRIYRLIRGNRISRNKFMHSILRKFELGSWSYSSSLPFLVYCIEVLSALPFECPDEPLYLIYDINRVIQLKAGSLESSMKTWNNLSQTLDPPKPLSENSRPIYTEDQHLDRHVSDLNSSSSGDLSDLPEEELHKLQADCQNAISLQLLLKLKRHLKIAYCLNDARCQAFSLKEHPKPSEALSRQNISFNIGEVRLNFPNSFKDVMEKYQDLKTALREDAMDYTTYTVELKRKRPTPRSSRSTKPSAQGKARAVVEVDSDNDIDDEDWTGGPRRLSFGGHQVNGGTPVGRVTRQRPQLG